MSFKTITIETKDKVGKILFNRPDVLNAYNETLAKEIVAGFRELESDDSVKLIVFSGQGKAFMAGADIKMVNAWARRGDPDEIRHHLDTLLNPNIFEDCAKPVIAAVNGFAFGMGFEIALACDFRIAMKQARFALPEVKIGLVPGGGGSQRLMQMVGASRTLEMIATGKPIDAVEAHRIGIVNALAEDGTELWNAVDRFAQRLISLGATAFGVCKQLVYQGGGMSVREGIIFERQKFCEILLTEDAREGTQAFLEKRQPEFKGK